MNPSARATEPIILDAYAARSCPVKVQNRFDNTVHLPRAADGTVPLRNASEALSELFAGGREFTDRVLTQIARQEAAVDLRALRDDDWSAAQEATASAVTEGRPLIIAPVFPLDADGHRSGQPDVLVRGADRADGQPGYLPIIVKRHKMLEKVTKNAGHFASPLDSSYPDGKLPLHGARFRFSRQDDLLQVAHYWRQLEALGWEAGSAPYAGVIGTDRLIAHGAQLAIVEGDGQGQLAVSWAELTSKSIRTFSRTAAGGWKLRSALERYDHEFAFRLKVASVARARVGGPDDPEPMVQPIVVRECDGCQWWAVCAPQLGDDDLSLRIDKSPLDVREISVLRSFGIRTVFDLVDADLDQLMPQYLPEVRHRPGADERLRLAARRARLLAEGVELERLTKGVIDLPPNSYEIDFDIETAADDRVYLWGFWVRDAAEPGTGRYVHFARFEDLDDADELALAGQALGWLVNELKAHPGAVVYHYSDYETVHIRRLVANSSDPQIAEILDFVDDHFHDLFGTIRMHFFGTRGLGLKFVANSAAGFEWRDEDPGGLNSQRWFNDAVHGATQQIRLDAARRVLEYNEDDVRATLALRDWLREQR